MSKCTGGAKSHEKKTSPSGGERPSMDTSSVTDGEAGIKSGEGAGNESG